MREKMRPVFRKNIRPFSEYLAAFLVSFLLMFGPQAAAAKELRFDLPIKCKMGVDCFIQNYVDVDPSKGRKDYTCGELSYNKHKGTDIRVKTLKDMEAGVAVLAAADGIVSNLREGVEDHYFSKYDKKTQKKVYNIGLGNVVILNHGGGWSTNYAHMKKGSIQVKKGDRVQRGDILGYVGLSGFTIFPHVHFGVRKRKAIIDPFSGPMKTTPCNMTEKSLWTEAAQKQLGYRKSGFLHSGFSALRPKDREHIESGTLTQTLLPRNTPVLFFFSYLFGLQPGDGIHMEITDPNGETVKSHRIKKSTRHRVSYYSFIGNKMPKGGWRKGSYQGKITITRGSDKLTDQASVTLQ